ncbi:MAG: TetR family transcriptional regulator [Sandaracinaceae bacterium]|nr:TetR family transcriptional regulator [Sandaracinaceae bacterium]
MVSTENGGDAPEQAGATRADATRALLLAAAAEALREGDAGFSMGEVARRAGVTRQAVYLHFRHRGELLVAAIAEINAELGLEAHLREVMEAPSGPQALDRLVATLVRHGARTRAVARALRRHLEDDPEARAAWARRGPGRAAAVRRVTRRLGAEGALRDDLAPADAAGLVTAIVSADAIEALVEGRGWSLARTAEALGRAVRAALLAP